MNVLTIVGTQGAGMTSMAMAYARERAAQFNDREETGILHIFFDSEYPEQLLRNYHTFIVEAEDFPSWNFKQLINYLAAECSPDAVIIVCGEPRR